MMNKQTLGVDTSKNKLDVSLIKDIRSSKQKSKSIPNNPQGFTQLLDWLHKNVGNDLSALHVIIEATGIYHQAVAQFLFDHGITVNVVNPADAAQFARSLHLHKTDKADSHALAQFGISLILRAKWINWQPEPLPIRQLKAHIARLDALEKDLQREQNRLEKALIAQVPDNIIQSINDMILHLQTAIRILKRDIDQHIDQHPQLKQDRQLLQSIPGVGPALSLRMMAVYRSRSFSKAAQMAAYLGLVPRMRESGTYRGKTTLSKRGDARIRALLYMPTVVAKRCNPDIRAHYVRMLANGKTAMQALDAGMRRLVHICFFALGY